MANVRAVDGTRDRQLAYSDSQPVMRDEAGRRAKAAKIVAVLEHWLGADDLSGLTLLDVGSSTGFIADELHRTGARVIGLDIDQPGLAASRTRLSAEVLLLCAEGERLPLADDSVDLVVFNHIYEHVLDPAAVMRELTRVLAPGGAMFLGFDNRRYPVEPHHRLVGLSWLPPRWGSRYLRAVGRGQTYHERLRSPLALRRLVAGLAVWDYTYTVLAEPERFAAGDLVPRPLRRLPVAAWRAVGGFLPTYLWVATANATGPIGPRGPRLATPPQLLDGVPTGAPI